LYQNLKLAEMNHSSFFFHIKLCFLLWTLQLTCCAPVHHSLYWKRSELAPEFNVSFLVFWPSDDVQTPGYWTRKQDDDTKEVINVQVPGSMAIHNISFLWSKEIFYDNLVVPPNDDEIYCNCYSLVSKSMFPTNYLMNSTYLGKIEVDGEPCASYQVFLGPTAEFLDLQVDQIAVSLKTNEIKQIIVEYGITWTFQTFDFSDISNSAFDINPKCPLIFQSEACPTMNNTMTLRRQFWKPI